MSKFLQFGQPIIGLKLEDLAAEERERHDDLSKPELGVILRGKCMYYYSRHYPTVYLESEEVGIDEAFDTVDSVIEQVLEDQSISQRVSAQSYRPMQRSVSVASKS
jgi:hypothetical protein